MKDVTGFWSVIRESCRRIIIDALLLVFKLLTVTLKTLYIKMKQGAEHYISGHGLMLKQAYDLIYNVRHPASFCKIKILMSLDPYPNPSIIIRWLIY